MMKNEDKFFEGIEDTLHAYEDAYVPGAWEEFQQKRNRKRFGVWFLRAASAAAVLLFVGYAAFLFTAKTPDTTELTANKKPVQQPVTQTIPSSVAKAAQAAAADSAIKSSSAQTQIAVTSKSISQPTTNNKATNPVQSTIAIAKTTAKKYENEEFDYFPANTRDSGLMAKNDQTVKPGNVVTNPPVQNNAVVKPTTEAPPEKVIATNPVKRSTGATRSVYDSLMNNKVTSNAVANNAERAKEKALSYSVVVQPSLGNQKFNFGSGVEVSYKITDRISVNSGIAYSSLNATTTSSVVSTRAGNVQNVNLAVSGFQVPVGVQYNTDKGFYVSAGVMGMSVVNNSMEYTYVTQNAVARTMMDSQGLSYNGLSVVSENKTEESKEKVANYLGFYILSAGKKQQVGKKNTVSFGPFLRVPFGAVSSEKIRLLQGGVTLGLGF